MYSYPYIPSFYALILSISFLSFLLNPITLSSYSIPKKKVHIYSSLSLSLSLSLSSLKYSNIVFSFHSQSSS